mgnify:CR=1 FL=1
MGDGGGGGIPLLELFNGSINGLLTQQENWDDDFDDADIEPVPTTQEVGNNMNWVMMVLVGCNRFVFLKLLVKWQGLL